MHRPLKGTHVRHSRFKIALGPNPATLDKVIQAIALLARAGKNHTIFVGYWTNAWASFPNAEREISKTLTIEID
jgi:hypothetical protein